MSNYLLVISLAWGEVGLRLDALDTGFNSRSGLSSRIGAVEVISKSTNCHDSTHTSEEPCIALCCWRRRRGCRKAAVARPELNLWHSRGLGGSSTDRSAKRGRERHDESESKVNNPGHDIPSELSGN